MVSQCTYMYNNMFVSSSFNRFHFKTLASIGSLVEEALVKCMGVERMTLEKCQYTSHYGVNQLVKCIYM